MADRYEVNTADLNLRGGPDSSSSANIVSVLSKGTKCEHEPSSLDNDKWIRIKIDGTGTVGFVARRFLDKLPEEVVVLKKYIVKVNGANVRAEPNSSSGINIVARLRAGDKCEHHPGDLDNSRWIRIRMDIDDTEMIGYIALSLLREDDGNVVISDSANELVAVHMPQNRSHVDRDNKQGRAFPLGELQQEVAAPTVPNGLLVDNYIVRVPKQSIIMEICFFLLQRGEKNNRSMSEVLGYQHHL